MQLASSQPPGRRRDNDPLTLEDLRYSKTQMRVAGRTPTQRKKAPYVSTVRAPVRALHPVHSNVFHSTTRRTPQRTRIAPYARYQNLDVLTRLWNTLNLPEGERAYAYRQLQRNKTLAQEYHRRLVLLISYKKQYEAALLKRNEIMRDLSRFLGKMRGSRSDLTYCLTRLRYITIKLGSLLNIARVLCQKPISLPSLTLLCPDASNWNTFLKSETFYNRTTTALLFTIFKFFGERTFQEVQNITNKYFDRCTKGKTYLEKCSILQPRDTDISYSCISKRSRLNLSAITCVPTGRTTPNESLAEEESYLAPEHGTHISDEDVSLYLLLGLEAEAVFDGDDLALKWNEFLLKRNGMYSWEDDEGEMIHYGKADWVPLLQPTNIRDMVVWEPMIQDDVAKMLNMLHKNHEEPVIIPVRDDVRPFETYFTSTHRGQRLFAHKTRRPGNVTRSRSKSSTKSSQVVKRCPSTPGTRKISLKASEEVFLRLSQPKHSRSNSTVKGAKPVSRAGTKRAQAPSIRNNPLLRSRSSAPSVLQLTATPCSTEHVQPHTPPPSLHIDNDETPNPSRAPAILPTISDRFYSTSPMATGPIVDISYFQEADSKDKGLSMLEVVETLMSILPRNPSPDFAMRRRCEDFVEVQQASSDTPMINYSPSAFGPSREPFSVSRTPIRELDTARSTMITRVQHRIPMHESPGQPGDACFADLWRQLDDELDYIPEVKEGAEVRPETPKNDLGGPTVEKGIVGPPSPELFISLQRNSTPTDPDSSVQTVIYNSETTVGSPSVSSVSGTLDFDSFYHAVDERTIISEVFKEIPSELSSISSSASVLSSSSTVAHLDPLERFNVPRVNLKKLQYKLDPDALRLQPSLIKFREAFLLLHRADPSSPDFDMVNDTLEPVLRHPSTSTDDGLSTFRDRYWDRSYVARKMGKLQRAAERRAQRKLYRLQRQQEKHRPRSAGAISHVSVGTPCPLLPLEGSG
ncbi:hypothetical protein GMRT_12751 [Giardia muris]|uniref:Uncharacterized protein n=1 Tax=Giardia muris TaxID=5742 RepID=A0A4Z1T624_GIAMU|nr:hypothetical protein GMRT_12751 [Giardia muris]|eukprot:TNJ28587.1 hypothetical protein GMRT_12751 [Giardia muris]